MPGLPLRPCKHTGCPALVASGYCDKHKPPVPKRRGEAGEWHELYNSSHWRMMRAEQLIIELYCRMCTAEGKRVRATDVDHVIPHRGNRKLFYDKKNLQSLCHRHHSKKTWRENNQNKQ
jgi:5-methylcytosine-specific restriction protein A